MFEQRRFNYQMPKLSPTDVVRINNHDKAKSIVEADKSDNKADNQTKHVEKYANQKRRRLSAREEMKKLFQEVEAMAKSLEGDSFNNEETLRPGMDFDFKAYQQKENIKLGDQENRCHKAMRLIDELEENLRNELCVADDTLKGNVIYDIGNVEQLKNKIKPIARLIKELKKPEQIKKEIEALKHVAHGLITQELDKKKKELEKAEKNNLQREESKDDYIRKLFVSLKDIMKRESRGDESLTPEGLVKEYVEFAKDLMDFIQGTWKYYPESYVQYTGDPKDRDKDVRKVNSSKAWGELDGMKKLDQSLHIAQDPKFQEALSRALKGQYEEAEEFLREVRKVRETPDQHLFQAHLFFKFSGRTNQKGNLLEIRDINGLVHDGDRTLLKFSPDKTAVTITDGNEKTTLYIKKSIGSAKDNMPDNNIVEDGGKLVYQLGEKKLDPIHDLDGILAYNVNGDIRVYRRADKKRLAPIHTAPGLGTDLYFDIPDQSYTVGENRTAATLTAITRPWLQKGYSPEQVQAVAPYSEQNNHFATAKQAPVNYTQPREPLIKMLPLEMTAIRTIPLDMTTTSAINMKIKDHAELPSEITYGITARTLPDNRIDHDKAVTGEEALRADIRWNAKAGEKGAIYGQNDKAIDMRDVDLNYTKHHPKYGLQLRSVGGQHRAVFPEIMGTYNLGLRYDTEKKLQHRAHLLRNMSMNYLNGICQTTNDTKEVEKAFAFVKSLEGITKRTITDAIAKHLRPPRDVDQVKQQGDAIFQERKQKPIREMLEMYKKAATSMVDAGRDFASNLQKMSVQETKKDIVEDINKAEKQHKIYTLDGTDYTPSALMRKYAQDTEQLKTLRDLESQKIQQHLKHLKYIKNLESLKDVGKLEHLKKLENIEGLERLQNLDDLEDEHITDAERELIRNAEIQYMKAAQTKIAKQRNSTIKAIEQIHDYIEDKTNNVHYFHKNAIYWMAAEAAEGGLIGGKQDEAIHLGKLERGSECLNPKASAIEHSRQNFEYQVVGHVLDALHEADSRVDKIRPILAEAKHQLCIAHLNKEAIKNAPDSAAGTEPKGVKIAIPDAPLLPISDTSIGDTDEVDKQTKQLLKRITELKDRLKHLYDETPDQIKSPGWMATEAESIIREIAKIEYKLDYEQETDPRVRIKMHEKKAEMIKERADHIMSLIKYEYDKAMKRMQYAHEKEMKWVQCEIDLRKFDHVSKHRKEMVALFRETLRSHLISTAAFIAFKAVFEQAMKTADALSYRIMNELGRLAYLPLTNN